MFLIRQAFGVFTVLTTLTALPLASEEEKLPLLAPAPHFAGVEEWINTQPLTMEDLKGKVVLIDFWTYSCANCTRTVPYLTQWYKDYHDKGFEIVGVHSPEFPFEKTFGNVQSAVQRLKIPYPVALDNEFKTWDNYANSYWPAQYLVDRDGIVRSFHFGEGDYGKIENQIRTLLGLAPTVVEEKRGQERAVTPETYLGSEKGDRYDSDAASLPDDHVALKGKWTVEPSKITSKSGASQIDFNFIGTRVYLVMDSKNLQLATVLLDGKPLPQQYYTTDMDHRGRLMIKDARQYAIVDLKGNYGRHLLSIQVPEGVSGYSFTVSDEK